MLAYSSASLDKDLKSNIEFFEKIKEELNWKNANYLIRSSSMDITSETGNEYTLVKDGTLTEGRLAYLDIADGSIYLYSNGYKQNEGELQEYQGDYIITGSTERNAVKVMDIGTYNITIKDLSIDLSELDPADVGIKDKALCAFNANGGPYSAGIGSGYTGFDAATGVASNIIINSGTITAKGGANGCGIGSSLYGNVNNIVINGGNIYVDNLNMMRFAIGATGKLDNLLINGGTITAIGYTFCGAIGGGEGSGKITINGGTIFAYAPSNTLYAKCHGIGQGCEAVEINGGTIVSRSNYCAGIFSTSGNVKIKGGTIFTIESTIPIGKLGDDGTTLESCIPTDGTNTLYLTQIQLENVTEKLKVKSLITSDNINYGITDMYTSEGGIVYLYLPKGERTITIVIGDEKYTGKVITDEENEIIILNEQ